MGPGGHRRRLKILHIDPERNWGGGESQVIGLLGYLSSRGHENHLLCHPEGPLRREAEKKGIAAFPVVIRNEFDLRPLLSLRRLIRREGYDLVHFHTKRAHALSLWLGRGGSAPKSVVTRRMDYPVKKNWYTRCLYNRRVDGVVAISRKIGDLLVEAGVERGKIRVIHSGVDPTPFLGAGKELPDPPVVGTVAVLEGRKGHRFLLEAAALLKKQGHRLLYRFAGEGSERERLERLAARLDLRDEVFFDGFVSDIASFFSMVDIFVLPSIYEGLGVSVLEAMAAAKPVVAARVGGIPELVEDGVTGFLVPAGDAMELARSLSRLISEKALVREMGERGRERLYREFTLEQMAKKNEDYYYELCEQGWDRSLVRREVKDVVSQDE